MEKESFDVLHYGKCFHKLSNILKRLCDENLAKQNITYSQLKVLVFISKNGGEKGVLQSDMEKEFGIRKSSVTSILQNMEKNGLIKRISDPADGRIKKVFLSESGKILDDDLKNYINNIESEIDKDFSDEEKVSFKIMLSKALSNLEKLEYAERKNIQ